MYSVIIHGGTLTFNLYLKKLVNYTLYEKLLCTIITTIWPDMK